MRRYRGESNAGSAPRTRGTRGIPAPTMTSVRISPADAGNTGRRGSATYSRADQPRGRGEHKNGATPSSLATGSAPRTRGTRGIGWPTSLRRRISPADAGNTEKVANHSRLRPDQPRGRGEHVPADHPDESPDGSAPRTRGTPKLAVAGGLDLRISPADAGNTMTPESFGISGPDQPRGRGEHSQGRGESR